MTVKLLNEHLDFLSLKGGYTGSSETTLFENATLMEITCHSSYYINITFPGRVIVENIIPRNVIINRGTAEVDNHISRDDIFRLSPSPGM